MSKNNSENPSSEGNVLSEIQIRAELHAGHLPPPDILERYERMQSGTLDRLLTIVEKEQQNKFGHNEKVIEYQFEVLAIRGQNDRSDNVFAHCGQIFGFVTVVMFFSALAYSMWLNNMTMFCTLFGAGAFAGLANLVRSFQNKNGKTL